MNKIEQKKTNLKEVKVEVVSQKTGLTSLQERCAVLLASGVRLSDVAKGVDVSRGTIYKWQNLVAFQCFYNLMKADFKNYVEGCLMNLQAQALEGINASLSSDNESTRLKASMWVLERISQIQVGETDVRKVVKDAVGIESCKVSQWEGQMYQDMLDDMGLEE